MNSNVPCVRCKKNARFICERCNDPYCTKGCQVLHWPFHRTVCFPMPSLLEMSKEQNMISMYDTRNSDNLALTYHTNFQNQYRFGPQNNNGRRNYNNQRSIRSDSGDIQRINSGDIQTVEPKKQNSVMDTRRYPLTEKPIPMGKEKEAGRTMPSGTRNSDGIINLAVTKGPETESRSEKLEPKKLLNWDEEMPNSTNELEQLMSNEPRNWQNPFPLVKDTFVTIVSFEESTTMSCWVVQNQYATKRKFLLDETKRLHSSGNNEAVESQTIAINELYCVQYEDNYYRCVCLYKINSKSVIIRLIDVGITFQTHTSDLKYLDPRLKTINAFVFEINFEKSIDVTIGQILRIYRFTVDATGTINVKLERQEKNNQIEVAPFPIGVPMELFCLDYSHIEKGYISACIHDPKKIKSINKLSDKIADYFKQFEKAEEYFPEMDEVCFAHHDSEHQWYRAECMKRISSDSFELFFIDYGSTRVVNSSNIRKLVSKFTEPAAIMHFCCIQGMPRQPTNELIKKIVNFFNENPIFSITNAKYDDCGMVTIDCPDLMKAMQ